MTVEEPEVWPIGRKMSLTEAIFRITANEDGAKKGSLFVGDLDFSKSTDNRAAFQDLTLLGHYIDYVEACWIHSPRLEPSFNSFPKYFDQQRKDLRFRQELSSGSLSHACNRIERQFLITLFPRSYGPQRKNMGNVDLNAGQLRVDLPIKRETARPTPSGWAYGRIGQILLRLQELGTHAADAKGFLPYLDLVLATVTAVSDTERRLRDLADPRSFLAKQAALSAARELANEQDEYEEPEKPVRIGRVIKRKSATRRKVSLFARKL